MERAEGELRNDLQNSIELEQLNRELSKNVALDQSPLIERNALWSEVPALFFAEQV